jgi:hypothetical protein
LPISWTSPDLPLRSFSLHTTIAIKNGSSASSLPPLPRSLLPLAAGPPRRRCVEALGRGDAGFARSVGVKTAARAGGTGSRGILGLGIGLWLRPGLCVGV